MLFLFIFLCFGSVLDDCCMFIFFFKCSEKCSLILFSCRMKCPMILCNVHVLEFYVGCYWCVSTLAVLVFSKLSDLVCDLWLLLLELRHKQKQEQKDWCKILICPSVSLYMHLRGKCSHIMWIESLLTFVTSWDILSTLWCYIINRCLLAHFHWTVVWHAVSSSCMPQVLYLPYKEHVHSKNCSAWLHPYISSIP